MINFRAFLANFKWFHICGCFDYSFHRRSTQLIMMFVAFMRISSLLFQFIFQRKSHRKGMAKLRQFGQSLLICILIFHVSVSVSQAANARIIFKLTRAHFGFSLPMLSRCVCCLAELLFFLWWCCEESLSSFLVFSSEKWKVAIKFLTLLLCFMRRHKSESRKHTTWKIAMKMRILHKLWFKLWL